MGESTVMTSLSYFLADELPFCREMFLHQCAAPLRFSRGEVLSRAGQTDKPLFFMLEGMVKIYTINPDGYIRILGYHQQNTLFAMDRICQDAPTVVTCEAVTNVRVLQVTWKDLTVLSQLDPALMPSLLRYYGKVLRLMCYDAEIKSIDSVPVRLASFLLMAANAAASHAVIALTQDEIASAVNASRVQIARVSSDFKQKGLIRTHRGGIEITDMQGLYRLTQNTP